MLSTISNALHRIELYSSLVIVEDDGEEDIEQEEDATEHIYDEVGSVPRAIIVWKEHNIRKASICQQHDKLVVWLIDAIELGCTSKAALEDEEAKSSEEEHE